MICCVCVFSLLIIDDIFFIFTAQSYDAQTSYSSGVAAGNSYGSQQGGAGTAIMIAMNRNDFWESLIERKETI